MAEQSPQKKGKSKNSSEDQRQAPTEEKKKEAVSVGPEMAAKRRRRHRRARLQKKDVGNENIRSAKKKLETEKADLGSTKKISKEQPKLQSEPQPKEQDQAIAEPLEDIYPSVQHHTFIGPAPGVFEATEELKKPVGDEDLRSGEEPKAEPQPEAKTEPTVIEPSLPETQPPVAQSEPEPSVPASESVTAGPLLSEIQPSAEPPVHVSEYEEKEPFPELFPSHETAAKAPEQEDNAAPEIIEQEEFVEESQPINQQELSELEEPDAHSEAVEAQEKSSGGTTDVSAGGDFSAGFLKKFGAFVAFMAAHLRFKYLALVAVMVFIGFLFASGVAINTFQSIYGQITPWFQPKTSITPVAVETRVDEKHSQDRSINTAYLFGKNRGSSNDIVPPSIKNAYYFGKLAEPAVKGETGITAAYHYGQRRDVLARNTLFIEYVHNLRELKSIYDTDLYAVLNQTTQRDIKLADYLAKIKSIRANSARIIKELGLQIDDLKISFNSLSPDRKNLEQDFFASIESLAGEKANFFLQSFVDVAQKQTALKARLSALQQILDLYEKSVKKLDIRIEAIEKNYEALLRGIRVVEIPGANLDIIIRPK